MNMPVGIATTCGVGCPSFCNLSSRNVGRLDLMDGFYFFKDASAQ